VLAVTAALAAASVVVGAPVAERLDPYSAEDPASESVRAAERLERSIDVDPDAGLIAVVSIDRPVEHPATMRRVEAVAERIFRDRSIGLVTSYYESGERAMVSRDGRLTYIIANFETLSDKDQQEGAKRLREAFAGDPGVKLGGQAPGNVDVVETVRSDIVRAELIAFPLLLLLGLWVFRSLVAALLPVVVGGLSIAVAVAALRVAAEALSVSIFALNLVIGLGLGLAIDYSLLIVYRFREELAGGDAVADALGRTMRTAGRAVLFSSLTVTAALAALLLFPQRFLYSMGLGGMAVSLIAGAAALIVLPAMLAVLGPRVNALAPRRLRHAGERDARPDEAGGWYRLSQLVMRRPGRIAVACAVLLVLLGIPSLGIRFTPVDTRVLPASAESRQARDALDSRFPPNPTLPIYAAVDARGGAAVDAYVRRLRRLEGVARVIGPYPIPERQTLIQVISRTGPQTGESEDLVRAMRAVATPFEVDVGGRTADFVDQKKSLAAHIPRALALLTATTLFVLFLMTGSVLLPLKALVMNVLTLSATAGLLVLIFQDGRLEALLDYTSQNALESSQLLVLFAVAFGLSTDYGVFLLERIREARATGIDNRQAVAVGLERSGRVVTAAALLLCVAIGAFATSQIVVIKQLGIGTALAVLIDATIVRALLVPALMELLGPWNWWAPGPLRRLHERLV
jgi:RND superfamily putative drug exporter